MILYIKVKGHGRMILDLVLNRPLVYGTIEVDGVTRTKTYRELSDKKSFKITVIFKLLILFSKQERKCKLYNGFDRFTSAKGESLHEYYLSLQLEWSRFMTDVTLAKNMHTSNYDRLYAYLSQHEVHATEVYLMLEIFPNPLALVANYHHIPSYQNTHQSLYNPSHYQQQLSPVAQQFYSSQSHSQSYEGNNASNRTRVTRCYNYHGEGHMARQCTQPKRPKNAEWFKKKILLVQAQEYDCDEAPSTKAVLIANLSNYDSNVILEVPISDTCQDNYVLDHCVQDIKLGKERLSETKSHLANFDKVVKVKTIALTLTKDTWGFEYTKYVLITEVIPFMNPLRESFKDFDNSLYLELNEMKMVFNQMKASVEQCSIDKKCFEIQKKELLLENDRLLELISQDLMQTIVNFEAVIVDYQQSEKCYVDEYNESLELKAELLKKNEMVEKNEEFY
nr:hypothetical protein [Tanacetum cinerariifolium]